MNNTACMYICPNALMVHDPNEISDAIDRLGKIDRPKPQEMALREIEQDKFSRRKRIKKLR